MTHTCAVRPRRPLEHEAKMEKSEMFGFSLEADDRTEEEKRRQKASKKGGVESPAAPMDTDYQEEMEETRPQIRFNLSFDKGIRGEDQHKRDSKTFTIDRLFEAVASGDVSKLDGLHQYLRQNMKKLSDSLCECDSYGKTALMKALLHLKDGENETVELLIGISEKMGDIKEFVNAAYTNSYYKGQTALHIAIERRNISYVKLLVSKGADVHAKACGVFFQPHNGPNFYFGELPLSLAACTNQPTVVDFLMENEYQRANAKMVDSQGNTVLHALVMVADYSKDKDKDNTEFITNIYDRILKTTAQLHPKLKLEDIENHKGLTPLKMAAKTGKIGNRHEMLQMEPLSRLLEEKWNKFGGRMFFINFLFYLLYLIVFTLVAYNKKFGELPYPLKHTTAGYLYVSGQLVIALANCYFFVIGLKRKRPKLQTLLIDGYYDILFFVQGVLFLITAGLYLFGNQQYLSFLVLCLALSWVNMLYFSRGDKHMGVYSIMIQKMILSDIMRFLLVYIVFLFGFSAAVVTLLKEPIVKNTTVTRQGRLFGPLGPDEECVKPYFRSISYTTLQLFKFTIGMGEMEFTQEHESTVVFFVLLISYIILTYILLLNMLIALMNRTVEKTTEESTSIWKLQRAITILEMEKRLSCCLRRRFRCGVEKNLRTALGDDRRRCFRVEEVNWNKWNINLGKINEDPGCWDRGQHPASEPPPNRAKRGAVKRRLKCSGMKSCFWACVSARAT
uniref:Transient receptor potential cation channel, subfamily V, member 1 n=1 Tax=Cyclopterus lumpus TaxID=8103 RepID=A0A8C2Z116_CYCLU